MTSAFFRVFNACVDSTCLSHCSIVKRHPNQGNSLGKHLIGVCLWLQRSSPWWLCSRKADRHRAGAGAEIYKVPGREETSSHLLIFPLTGTSTGKQTFKSMSLWGPLSFRPPQCC